MLILQSKNGVVFCKIFIFIGLVCFSAGQPGTAQNDLGTNVEVMAILADSLLQDVTSKVRTELRKDIVISQQVSNVMEGFLRERAIRVLDQAGDYSLYLSGDSSQKAASPDTSTTFDLRTIDLGVTYQDYESEDRIEQLKTRVVNVRFFLSIIDRPTGRLLFSAEVAGTKTDILPEDQIPRIENEDIMFSIGKQVQTRQGGRFPQALLIAGVTGVTVFLLYAIRSR